MSCFQNITKRMRNSRESSQIIFDLCRNPTFSLTLRKPPLHAVHQPGFGLSSTASGRAHTRLGGGCFPKIGSELQAPQHVPRGRQDSVHAMEEKGVLN